MFLNYWDHFQQEIALFNELGDFDEAVESAKRLVARYPGSSLAHQQLGDQYAKNGDKQSALEAFKLAYEKDPGDPEAICKYTDQLIDSKQFEVAISILSEKIDSTSKWEKGGALYVRALARSGKPQEAIDFARGFLGKFPGSVLMRLELISVLLEQNSPVAQSLISESLPQIAGDPSLLEQLSQILADNREIQGCLEATQMLVQQGKHSEDNFLRFAECLISGGEAGQAKQLLETLIIQHSSVRARKTYSEYYVNRPRRQERVVLFVAEKPKVREAKLAAGLREAGWDVVLLFQEAPNYEATKFFSEAKQYTNPQHALTLAEQYPARLQHVFSAFSDETSVAFIKEKQTKVIFDYIDVWDGLINGGYTHQSAQRYCLTEADALVCRDLQAHYAARVCGYRLPRSTIFFPEYCWDQTPSRELAPQREGEIHVVQCGWVDIERSEGIKELSYLDLFEAFARDNVHVHLYQHVLLKDQNMSEAYQDFFKLAEETGCVHVHSNVPLTQVVSELEQYDIGINVITTPEGIYDEKPNYKTDANIYSCGSARNTDYLDACLPIITSKRLGFQYYYIKRFGMRIPCNKELLSSPRQVLAPFATKEAREVVRSRRKNYTVSAQTPRLVKFYQALA